MSNVVDFDAFTIYFATAYLASFLHDPGSFLIYILAWCTYF